jgi:hypothetical protein
VNTSQPEQGDMSQSPIAWALHVHATNGRIRDWRPTEDGWTVDVNGGGSIHLWAGAEATTAFLDALASAAQAPPRVPVSEHVAAVFSDAFEALEAGIESGDTPWVASGREVTAERYEGLIEEARAAIAASA